MSLRVLLFIVSIVVFSGCATKKKQAELLEQTKPTWLKERPVNSSYYFGIGITSKIGSPLLFEDKAKERALADVSSQISSTIKSESMLYQVEDKNGVREYLQNRIKSTSVAYLEGYEYLDKWEDLSNVYVFYQLSKQKFREIKAKRKADAINTATEKYMAGLQFLSQGSHVNAVKHFALCIDILSGYLNESTTTIIKDKSVDLVSESTTEMTDVIRALQITISDSIVINAQLNTSNDYFVVSSKDNGVVSNMPVKFRYSGGYLINELAKTNDKGMVYMPELPKNKSNSKEMLSVEIDLVNLGRQVTGNLYVRKIIEQQKAAKLSLDVASL